MKQTVKQRYKRIRREYERQFKDNVENSDLFLRHIDDFVASSEATDLEKQFYLLLNQFPTDSKPYVIIPKEKVFIKNSYDLLPPPYMEYEIDFAVYGGLLKNPVKIAIECDGIRSHKLRHSEKDRRKEVNLQMAGWLVIRIPGHEIHQELDKWDTDENFVSEISLTIENVIKNAMQLVDNGTYTLPEVRSKLTGYKWGYVTCSHCGQGQMGILNHKRITCRHCNKVYLRDRSKDPEGVSEFEGLLYFPDQD